MPSNTDFDINSLSTGEESTGEVDFSGFADDNSQGAWPTGWYNATIVEGYATRKGYQFLTEDVLSKNNESRNIRICFNIVNTPGQTRNLQEQFNYRPDLLLNRDGLNNLEIARKEFADVRSWPGEARTMQSSSITLGRIGQLQRATGAKLVAAGGQFGLGLLVGAKLQVRLGIDEKGYNNIREFKARK